MFVCAHYEEVAKKMRQIPLAVHVGWFMLGGLLLGFDYWLLTLVGIGLLLVWLFTTMKADLFNLHYKGIMVIIPAMVTAIFMGAFWPRFNSLAASVAIVGGAKVSTKIPVLKNLVQKLDAVIIGGGMVDEQICQYVDADHWVSDAMAGVRLCEALLYENK